MTADSGVLIVPAQARDAAVLARLHGAAFAEGWDEAALARLLEAPAARGFIATQGYDPAPVGFVLALLAVDEAEIISIAVREDCRQRGVGSRLIGQLIEALREEGARSLFLDVAADNAAALGLYRSLGFSQFGARKGYYPSSAGLKVDGLMLKLDITGLAKDGRSDTPCL